MTDMVATNQTVLLAGAGISGITAPLQAAESGNQVIAMGQRAFIGGRNAQLLHLSRGKDAKLSGVDGQAIRAMKLEHIATK